MSYFYLQVKTKFKVLGLLLFTIATSFCCNAQDRSEEDIDLILDDILLSDKQFLDELIESPNSYNFFYTSVAYNSNTYFSGRDSGTNQYHLIPQISYYHSSGFNASVSGFYYQNFSPSWDFTSLSLGYLNTACKNNIVIYGASYTKFFYSDDFDDFTNSLDINLGIRNKKKTLGSTIAASYLFGSDTSYQIVSSSFARINLLRKTTFALRLIPTVNFVIAQQQYTYRQRFSTIPFFRTISQEIFNLLNTQILIPFSFTSNSWDLELGYTLNIPNAVANESNLPTTNLFSISIGYLFDFK